MINLIFVLIALVLIFIIVYRKSSGKNVLEVIKGDFSFLTDKLAPYSYKEIKEKVKQLGQDYSKKQYIFQVLVFGIGAGAASYIYFYNIFISIVYAVVAISIIPYLSYLRYHRIYSEFIFEQIQTYTTNVIMDFATSQSFVKSLESIIQSNILEDPVKSDVQVMIDMTYKNGTIDEALAYFESKYDYFIVKNMHLLFLQITNEGAKDAAESLENMSLDIDMLVESVYRDREDRAVFQRKFLRFGIILYGMIMLIQILLGHDTYLKMLDLWYCNIMIHGIVLLNSFFLIKGEKYYNENVGAK